MIKRIMTVAAILAVAASMSLSSCIGSFALTNKLLDWNKSIDNKFVNELVFVAFLIIPVYEVASAADLLVLNSIEFWTGESPIAQSSEIIDCGAGRFLVERDTTGYTITSLDDQSSIRLNYDQAEQSWSYVGISGTEYQLMSFVDTDHIRVNIGDDRTMLVERSQRGLYALQQAVAQRCDILAYCTAR